MEGITQFFSVVSSWAVAITAIIACLSAIFKPIRDLIIKIFGFRKSADLLKQEFSEIKSNLNEVKEDLAEIKRNDEKRDEELECMKNNIQTMRDDLGGRIQRVSDENDDNEKSRIRREVMQYGMKARRLEQISEREFESLRLDYEKYHGHLHGNGLVTEEYNMIVEYFNKNYPNWM